MHTFAKLISLALVSSTLMVGCVSKPPKSQKIVAPIGGSAYGGVTSAAVADGNTPYTGGALVNNSTAIQNAAAQMQAVVHFDFDSDVIRPDAATILDQHAAFLNNNQEARVQVAGHTDERGSREYNMSLGERRAAAVRGYLASQGASVDRIEILSFGEEQPVATESNEEAWAQNRRAELSY